MESIPYHRRFYRLAALLSASLTFTALAAGCAPRAAIRDAGNNGNIHINTAVTASVASNDADDDNADDDDNAYDETAAVPHFPVAYEPAFPDRLGILVADALVYDVSAGGVLEYRDDWSRRASRQAAVSAAIAMKKIGADPVVIPDLRRARDLARLKTAMRYHGSAFQSDSFADKNLAGGGGGDMTAYSLGPLDSLCARYGVSAFLYVYGYEERFSEERRRVLSEWWRAANEAAKAPEVRAAPQLPLPAERVFTAAMMVNVDGRIARYSHSLMFNNVDITSNASGGDPALSGLDEPEMVHTGSLIAQSKGMERRFSNQNLFFDDRYLEEYLNEILEKLATPDERKQYDLRVRLLRSGAVNAFAAPDGAIYVCTGLLARIEDEAQAAAVLAHELAHVVNRHTAKNLSALKDTSRAQTLAAIAALKDPQKQTRKPKPETAPTRKTGGLLLGDGITGSMTGDALRAAVSGYKRELEREADSAGLARMIAAGYPREGFKSLFAMLLDWAVTERIDERYFFSSHPMISERLENYDLFAEKIDSVDAARKSEVPDYKINLGKSDVQEDVIEKSFFTAKFRSVILYDAVANHAAGRPDLVDAQLGRVLSADSSDVDALIMRGEMERQMSPRSAAPLAWYEKALMYEPGNLAALRATGFAYHAIGDFDKAREYLRRYCEIAEDAPDINMAREALRQCGE